MAESKKFYFWKQNDIRSRSSIIIIAIVVMFLLLGAGGGLGYYYLIYQPEQERLAQLERVKKERSNQISAVQNFYMQSLAGGSISNAIALMQQIYLSREKLSASGFDAKSISCDEKNCAMSYGLRDGRIFNVVDINIWGNIYSPSFSGSALDFSDIESRLNLHPWLKAWQDKVQVDLPVCTNILSYISSWNSIANKNLQIVLDGFPTSAVLNNENNLKDAVYSFGMMYTTWTLNFPGVKNMTTAALALQKQHFSDAFIVKSIVIDESSMLVKGGLACKKGN